MKEDSALVAYCGLYCGDCSGHKGEIADLSKELRKKLREARFESTASELSKYFKPFSSYKEAYDFLGALVRMRCKVACRGGGGNPWCKIRACARKKELEGCWDCETFETCTKLAFLEGVHGIGHLKNLQKIKKNGMKAFLEGTKYWYAPKPRK